MSLLKFFGLERMAILGRILKENGGIMGAYKTLYRSVMSGTF